MRPDRSEGGSAQRDWISGLVSIAVAVAGAQILWLRYHSSVPDPKRFAPTDLANYYYPIAETVGRRLAAGELPLWNPDSCSGIPLLATLQPGVLYPAAWLAALLPTADALWLGLLVQVLLAGAFMAAALRATGHHPAAAGLGGAFYVQACLLGNLAWPPAVATMIWLPLQWLCVEKLAAGRGARWIVALALATGLQLLAGFPQYTAYGFYWLVPYAALRLWESSPGASLRLRRGVSMAAAIALGVGLAAAQLVPTAELVGQSARGEALTASDIHYLDGGTLPAKAVVRNAFDPRPRNPTFDLKAGTGYLGIGSLFAAVAALVLRRRSPRTWFFAGAGLLSLLLSDGFHGFAAPLFSVYHELPTAGLFRTPERLRFISMLCWIALACGGLDALLRRAGERPSWTLLAAFAAVAAAVVVLGGPGSGWRLGVALALVAGLLLLPARAATRALLAAAWVGFSILDLGLATAPAGVLHAYPAALSERYQAQFRSARIEDGLLDELKSLPGWTRVEPYGFLPFHAAGSARGLQRAACYEPLSPGAWRRVSEVLEPAAELRGGIANPDPEQAPVFYDITSVSQIVRPRRGNAISDLNPDALPRAYWVGQATRATPQQSFEHIRDGSFDFQRGVLLESEGESESGIGPALVAARIASYRPERVEIEVDARHDGWLVLTDTFYPGWQAEIDGRPVEILRANGLFRALRVAAGDGRVVFEYRPRSLAVGLGVSALSLALVCAVGVFAWRRSGSS